MYIKNNQLGFTLQSLLCKKFNIIPDSDNAIKQFNAGYDSSLETELLSIINGFLSKIDGVPVRCTTFLNDKDGIVPYNFVLSNRKTLSIRTNKSGGSKVSPRHIGQAGFGVLNDYFEEIYGKKIKTKNDIKKLFINKISEIMPKYVDEFLDADYIVWVYGDKSKYKFEVIDGNSMCTLDYKKENFSFTRELSQWNNSNSIKYKNVTIAEAQIFNNSRNLIFRFSMNNFLPLLVEESKIVKINNETFGMSAEKTVCDKFKLSYPKDLIERSIVTYEKKLKPIIDDSFVYLPAAIKYTGKLSGSRGKSSKCSYDFILAGDYKLSLKTNISGYKVCPPEVGQPSPDTCYLYFKDFVDGDYINKEKFKKMVLERFKDIWPIYLEHLFDSEFMLWIYTKSKKLEYKILEQKNYKNFDWDYSKFAFTKNSIEEWNVSNTVKYDGISIGEFEVHHSRSCFKFRFDMKNLIALLNL